MRSRGYDKHLITQQHDLNAGTAYAGRMVGMRPEAMPLDEHLNQDIHDAVDRHVNLTQHLPADHPHKFSKRTPKQLSKAYHSIWDPTLGPDAGAPTSKRIKEDVERVVNETYIKIFERRGRVLNTASYVGRRALVHRERVAGPWGGKRSKGTGRKKAFWVHPDILCYENEILSSARSQWYKSQKNFEK